MDARQGGHSVRWLVAGVCGLALALVGLVTVFDDPPPPPAAPPLAATGGGLLPGAVPAKFESLVLQAGSMCAAAPPAVIAAQIQQESGWNTQAVSSAGAVGISQFLPSTWPNWAKPGQSPLDPTAAIPAQGRYDCAIARTMAAAQQAGQLPKSLDLTSAMLAGYNAGPAAVLDAGGIPDNGQTPGYVQAILASAPGFAGATGVGAAVGTFAAREIAAARQYLGTPYAWDGGSYVGPTTGDCVAGAAMNDCFKVGFDCSGLVMRAVYAASGGRIQLSHSADAQTRTGTRVPISQLRPGDLISFTNPGETVAHHIGIYLGNDQMINAPESNAVVRIDSLNTPYYRSQVWRAVRYG
ncbi:MAG TPA: NlpC/P60 family protein [Jatrophihabitans sp.]|nr:NlpC/P60 family protein [Jatrophihabitans sp.]